MDRKAYKKKNKKKINSKFRLEVHELIFKIDAYMNQCKEAMIDVLTQIRKVYANFRLGDIMNCMYIEGTQVGF